LQIDTDLLLTVTSTTDKLSAGRNIDDLQVPWNFFSKSGFLVIF